MKYGELFFLIYYINSAIILFSGIDTVYFTVHRKRHKWNGIYVHSLVVKLDQLFKKYSGNVRVFIAYFSLVNQDSEISSKSRFRPRYCISFLWNVTTCKTALAWCPIFYLIPIVLFSSFSVDDVLHFGGWKYHVKIGMSFREVWNRAFFKRVLNFLLSRVAACPPISRSHKRNKLSWKGLIKGRNSALQRAARRSGGQPSSSQSGYEFILFSSVAFSLFCDFCVFTNGVFMLFQGISDLLSLSESVSRTLRPILTGYAHL